MANRLYIGHPKDRLPADVELNHMLRLRDWLKDKEYEELVFSPSWDITDLEALMAQGFFDGKRIFIGCRNPLQQYHRRYPKAKLQLYAPNHLSKLFDERVVTSAISEIDIPQRSQSDTQFRPVNVRLHDNRLGSQRRIMSLQTTMPRFVSVVICSRKPELATACLDAIAKNAGIRFEVVLVSPTPLDIPYKHIWVEAPEPWNAAEGYNRGIRAARHEVVALVNDDFTLETPSGLLRLALLAAQRHVGIAAPSTNVTGCATQKQRDVGIVESEAYIPSVCWVFRKSVIEEVGYHDPSISQYYGGEDVDLCYRIAMAGYRLLIDTDVYGNHIGRATWTQERRRKELPKSTELNIRKWGIDIGKTKYWSLFRKPYDCVTVVTCKDDTRDVYHAVDSARVWGSDYVIVVHDGCETHAKLFEHRPDVYEIVLPVSMGQMAALNIGIEWSRAKVIHPIDADDRVIGSLRVPTNMIISGECDVVAGSSSMTGHIERLRVPSWDRKDVLYACDISHGAYLFRRDLFDYGLCYDETLIAGGEHEFLCQLAWQDDLRLGIYDQVIHEYRTTPYHSSKKYWINRFSGAAYKRFSLKKGKK